MAIDFNDPEAVRLYVADLEERDRKRQRLHEKIAILEEKVASLQQEKEEGAYLREEKEEAVQKINALVQENQGLKLETKTAKRETEGSPLLKYIKISQKTFRTKLVVEENPKRRTKGASVTKIDGKVYPHKVKPWKGFLDKQRVNFEAVCQAFPPDYRGFYCSKTLDDISKQSVTPIANEVEVSDFISINTEKPVKDILAKLKSLDPHGEVCRISGIINFRTSVYEVNEPDGEGLTGCREDIANLRPDRLRVCSNRDLVTGSTTMLYVCEFKPPRVVTITHVLEAFQPTTNLRQNLLNTSHEDAKGMYALIRIYDYIMDSGTRYGILNTGEAIVFLYVDPNKPRTLQYHVVQPLQDIPAKDDEEENEKEIAFMSVIGQYVAFTVMILKASHEPGQEERLRILNSLPRWNRPSAGHVPEDGNSFSGPSSPQVEGASAGSSPPEDGQGASGSPGDSEGQSGQSKRDTKTNQLSGGKDHCALDRPYCTQRCLLGLVQGDFLDSMCPNVTLHCQGKTDEAAYRKRHPVNHSEWLSLLWAQFKHSIDEGIVFLGIFGAKGWCFKITLLAYGYTFVGKGAVPANVESLQHESNIYKQLEPIQGSHVPVFLGAVDLRKMNKHYWIDIRVHVVHFMFLSWGGHHVEQDEMVKLEIPRSRLIELAEQAMDSVHEKGVIHQDMRWENVLFNPETKGVMVIDFEQSDLVGKPTSLEADMRKQKAFRKSLKRMRCDERDSIVLAVQERLVT
ncbi:hypothetical protein E4U31_000666 [Claviceps sp. LM219 group G6]|nr:hypothetical protein E4U31_000666 [Claviceps sp. LM219 group G6]